MKMRSSQIPELPSSVVVEILRRLPLKTLVQCRYVCKAWNAMLAEIYFFALYSTHTPTTLVIRVKGDSLDSLRDIFVVDATDESTIVSRDVYVKTGQEEGAGGRSSCQPNLRYQLGNSCNGLICLRELRSREPIVVWNPILGQFLIIPKAATASNGKVVAGFGFSPRLGEYKVLRIFQEMKSSVPSKWVAEIYNFGAQNSKWRKIGDAPCEIPSRVPGFFIHSGLHWILDYISSTGVPTNQLICCFDFEDEGFRFMQPPPIFSLDEKDKYHWSNLGILAGCLSICAIDAKVFRPDVEVWVMEDYGVSDSWVKKLSIRDPAVDWWDPYRWIQVTNFLKNGMILILCGHRYILAYDPQKRRFHNMEDLECAAIAHIPSFVSLKSVVQMGDSSSPIVQYL